MPTAYNLTAKEINALMQALRIADEAGELEQYLRRSEANILKDKLQKAK